MPEETSPSQNLHWTKRGRLASVSNVILSLLVKALGAGWATLGIADRERCKQCKLHQFTQPKHEYFFQQLGHKYFFLQRGAVQKSGPKQMRVHCFFNQNQINRGMFHKRLEILVLQLRHTYYPLGTSTSSSGTLCKHCG